MNAASFFGMRLFCRLSIFSVSVSVVWGIDITYIRLKQGWMYSAAIIDWYSRAVLSWSPEQRHRRFISMTFSER
ncbi:hypothetical protein QS257_06315 [Terrilactibacillus sp. S3-3]|nr:hypothetical protein QS257_06315 [Terrilactibacillus sp. S3-3]